ncbi:ABC transporter ATP-binding protein [Nafulsella turpanensis]|uniref:ABC transporter ATP-binding protein n=1 Tax=Nafulsella turpanensis TaxID=1265690 RepID=UPI000349A355|nr:ATP-binding cassette domain-containing protein [Nafulsella turpanensis]
MVELKNIHFSYKKKKKVLFNGLNLQLKGGYIYGLLGKNGAGKTSLLKHMAGLLYPKMGECLIKGQQVKERQPEVMQELCIIPEEFALPAVSINAYVAATAPFYPRFSREQFSLYLREFELTAEEKLSAMSYGQKKKFMIAFGLATNARLLLLDEPTNGLDIPSKSQFRKIIASALEEEKIIVISTHQVRDLENLIDVVVVLEQGQIAFQHNIANISEKLRFVQDTKGFSADEVLYQDAAGGRQPGIVKNLQGAESRVDLELLFNGIMKNPAALEAVLNKQQDYVY